MTASKEQPSAFRSGEELDMNKLRPWLDEHLPGLHGDCVVTQYSGGASNWTYRLRFDNEDLILRRPPAGKKAKRAHDMGREFRLQKALRPAYPFVPEMRIYCGDESILGAEFYIMERVDGIIPRKNLPRDVHLSPAQVRQMCTNVLDRLVDLHQVDIEQADLQDLGAGAGYVRRQVEGWSKRYTDARTWNVPKGRWVMDWLANHIPVEERICVTHNDYRFDNVVLNRKDPSRVVAVLDWELATLGDPLVDLGGTLAYWVEAGDDPFARSTRRQPTHLPGMLTRDEVIRYYLDKTGFSTPDFTFYQVLGLFRLAGIAQQIYYRYYHGQTRNPAFKTIWIAVNYLFWRCRRLIKNRR